MSKDIKWEKETDENRTKHAMSFLDEAIKLMNDKECTSTKVIIDGVIYETKN